MMELDKCECWSEWRSLSNGHGVVVGDDGVSRHGGGGFWVI